MKCLDDYRMKLVLMGFVAVIVLGGETAKADFTFGEPTNLGPTVNTSSYDELPTFISADGLEMYIFSNRPGSLGNFDLWVMTRETKDDDWETAINLGPSVNHSVRDTAACMSADGLELYFASYNRPGGYGSWDIWVSSRQTRNDPWSTAVNLGLPINSSSRDGSPSISADGLEFYFSSNRPGGQGTDDIWVTRRTTKNDPWGEPVNLGAIVNSSALETGVKISSDSLLLFFSGDAMSPYRPGGFGRADMWMTRKAMRNDEWNKPVNLGPLVNSSFHEFGPLISGEGDTLYFGSDRSGGSGGMDIWQAPIIPIVDLNSDHKVDLTDMHIMVDHWGENYPLCDIGPTPLGDGIVDVEDLKVLAEHLFEEIFPIELIGYWKLDESEGDIAYNSIGDNHGILSGNPTWQPDSGQVAGALEFDGIDDYVSTDFVLDPANGAFSVLAWIKGGSPGQVVLSQAGAANWLCTDSIEGYLMTELKKDSGRFRGDPLSSEAFINDGNWHRIGFVWDGLCRHLYVDGMEVANDAEPLSGLNDAYGGLYFGTGSSLASGTFFSGLIDDVRIYNRAVSP